jgi:signal transduction histidine kinase
VGSSLQGLKEGFEELVNQVHERYRIRVQMQLDLPTDLLLDENAATNLFRIAQEAVLNAARHADAQSISLRLAVTGADLELLVVDDGKGFDPLEVARGGTGLRIMRFRAQLVGGYLAVESRPGAGTTLRCRCPVKANREVA